jgi:signal transduction histidine kinase
MAERKNVTYQFRQKRLGDERYFTLAANAPILDVRGQTVVRGVTQDITESVRNQNMIRSQAEHIAHSNQELQRLNTYLRDFTQLASHDLRSPLNNMEVLLGMLAERVQFDSGAEVVHDKLKHAIGTMQQSLSTFTTILEMQGNDGLEFENLFLPDLVRSSWETLTANLPDQSAELSLDFSAWKTVRFPRYQMLSVIQNFLSNAIKYRKPNDSLVMNVRSEWEDHAPVLVFQDNGRGMDLPKMQHRLFRMNERFHLDIEGKGVGLHLIYTLVRAHGGNIEVQSIPNQGTTFRVRLASATTQEA